MKFKIYMSITLIFFILGAIIQTSFLSEICQAISMIFVILWAYEGNKK
jgi:hypothetical protein